MVNELRELMREASAGAPQDDRDLRAVLGSGRRRVRVRRVVTVGGTALAAGAIALGSSAWLDPSPPDLTAAGVPRAEGTVVGLAEARAAIEGRDYRELASYTNEDLESDNGEYYDGVTDDGLVLFREGQTSDRPDVRYSLLDPATGKKYRLPTWPGGGDQAVPLELGTDRIVLWRTASVGEDLATRPTLDVYERSTGTWRTIDWPRLTGDYVRTVRLGPDGRAYLTVMEDRGSGVLALWSASLTDPTDLRDEELLVGELAFEGDTMVWTDATNGDAGRIHVRHVGTGEETSFDPRAGGGCNLLGFDVAGGRIAMTQYCGTYEDGVRDERVQVVTTDGEQVVTVQDSGIDAGDLVAGGDYLTLTARERATRGTYVYDFEEGRLLRLSDGYAQWSVAAGPTPGDQFLWGEPAGRKVGPFGRSGATAHLGELIR